MSAGDLIAITFLRQCLPGFSTLKLLIFSFHTLFFGSKPLSLAQPGAVGSGVCLHILFGILPEGRMVSSSYLFIQLFYVNMNSVYLLCVIVQYYIIYFVAQIVPTLATGNSFWLSPMSL